VGICCEEEVCAARKGSRYIGSLTGQVLHYPCRLCWGAVWAAASVALPHHPIASSAPPNRFVPMAQSHLRRRASQRSLRFANKGPGVDWGWGASHGCERHSHMLSAERCLSSQSGGAGNDDTATWKLTGGARTFSHGSTRHRDTKTGTRSTIATRTLSLFHSSLASNSSTASPPQPPSPSSWPRSACTGPAPAGAIAMSSSCRHSKCSKPSFATTTLLPRVGAKHNVRRRTEEHTAGAHFHPLTS
jgi:hypothetical protein